MSRNPKVTGHKTTPLDIIEPLELLTTRGVRYIGFVNLKAEDVFFEEQLILITKAKGGKSRYVPIERMQKFLGHDKLEIPQVYAEASTEMRRESYQRVLGR